MLNKKGKRTMKKLKNWKLLFAASSLLLPLVAGSYAAPSSTSEGVRVSAKFDWWKVDNFYPVIFKLPGNSEYEVSINHAKKPVLIDDNFKFFQNGENQIYFKIKSIWGSGGQEYTQEGYCNGNITTDNLEAVEFEFKRFKGSDFRKPGP